MNDPGARRMLATVIALGASLAACGGDQTVVRTLPPKVIGPATPGVLRSPDDFAAIADKDDRSRALFLEATRVMFHPRCVNCHPSDDSPRQGDLGMMHDPPVLRGPKDEGVTGM